MSEQKERGLVKRSAPTKCATARRHISYAEHDVVAPERMYTRRERSMSERSVYI